jgi:Tannase and feruloyl esterase
MKHRARLGLLGTVSLMALMAGGNVAWADTVCDGSMTGTLPGKLVVPVGRSCTLYQAHVGGSVQVSQNASLTVDGLEEWTSIAGNIQADRCASTLLEGSVTVGGNVLIQHCTGTSGFAGPGVKIRGKFTCQNNQGSCTASLGEIDGDALIQNNSGNVAGDISLNVIGGNLQCQGNAVAQTHDLGGDWVTRSVLGQCAANLGFAAAPYACSSLAGLSLPDTTIFLAQTYTAGSVIHGTTTAPVSLCRVVGNIHPSTNPAHDSNINFEVWLPTSNWTGRYEQVGNGGFAGSIEYTALKGVAAINNAAVSTDDGSSQPTGAAGGSFALGHPQRINDYGYRAVHLTDLDAQVIATAFYGTAPAHAYFNGCSKGGEEALMEAQRYPDDFDGILGGAPANTFVPLLSEQTYNATQVTNPNNLGGFIPSSDLPAITNAVQTACAKAKTVATDNFLGNPMECRFNPQTLFASILTPAQITALSNVYNGIVTNVGLPPFNFGPGPEPGNEAQLWPGNDIQAIGSTLITPPTTSDFGFGNGIFTQFLQQPTFNTLAEFNPHTSPETLNRFAIDPPSPGSAAQTIGSALTADNPDLSAFKAHGGKLIEYHGWADPLIGSLYSVNHYDGVVAFEGHGYHGIQSYYRLFMAPGMGHCSGGPGLNSFGNVTSNSGSGPASSDIFTALETWVEQGVAPKQVIATDAPNAFTVGTFTRPLCPYPQNATYIGGNTSDAASFVCR